MSKKVDDENNTDEKIEVGEHVNRLLKQYEQKSKSFGRYFAILVGISILLLFLLLLPYVFTQELQRDSLNKNITLSSVIKVFDTVNNTHSTIDKLQIDIQNFHNDLMILLNFKNLIINESTLNAYKNKNNYSTYFDKCPHNSGLQECRDLANIAIGKFNETIHENITEPIKTLDSVSLIKLIHAPYLRELSTELHNTSLLKLPIELNNLTLEKLHVPELSINLTNTSKIVNSLLSLENQTQKFENATNLANIIDSFGIKFHTNSLDKVSDSIGVNPDDQQQMRQYLNKLNITNSTLRKNLENITNRLNEIETPIGRLTIGFSDIILAFPFAIASGFLVCMYLLTEAIHFRREFLYYYPMKYKDKQVLNKTDLARGTPLWLDPEIPEQNKKIRFLVLLLPLVIFVTSSGLIFYSFSISTPENSLLRDYVNQLTYQITFVTLYVIIGSVFFIYSFNKILNEYNL